MYKVAISTMKPDAIMRKPAFKRLRPKETMAEANAKMPIGNRTSLDSTVSEPLIYDVYSQADFLREFDINSHKINSIKYYPDILNEKAGHKITQKIRSRTAIGFQQIIFTKRLTALIGNNVSMRLIKSGSSGRRQQDTLAMFREGWEEKNMEVAMHETLSSDGKTGDCAVCFYLSDRKLGWRTFSYENGDILYPHFDPMTGELALFGRLYSMPDDNGNLTDYLDVYDRTSYMRYRKSKVFGWKVDVEPVLHGYQECPVAYHRNGNPFWYQSQDLIDSYEVALSQFCENNAAYALRILYALGQSMEVKASLDGTPMRIDSPDPNAKIGFLEPADASNSFVTQLKTMEKDIMRASFVVDTPEIKSGADMSSLTVKMLFADTYLKALEDAQNYQMFLARTIRLFKYGYGIETGKVSDMEAFRVKAEFSPFIFMSETETVNSIVQLVGSGVLSKQTASEIAYESGYGTADEWDRIINEAHEEYAAAQDQAQSLDVVNNARSGGGNAQS